MAFDRNWNYGSTPDAREIYKQLSQQSPYLARDSHPAAQPYDVSGPAAPVPDPYGVRAPYETPDPYGSCLLYTSPSPRDS